MNKIKWGVLSTAKIGVEKVIPALQKSLYGEVTAIASRSGQRAQKAADKLNISTAYDSYEKLLADSNINAVYIPLPNHLHIPWTVKSLEAGKHVLCEKPIGLSATEARELAQKAAQYPGLKVMEAFMYRFHPQWKKVRRLVLGGSIGQLKSIHSVFTYFNDDPDDIRNKPDIGGGGLMDIGCYNISLSRYLFDEEPARVIGHIEFDPNFEVDRLASGMMEFGNGTATFTCGTQLSPDQYVAIYGTSGRIEIEKPFNMPPDQSAVVWLHLEGEKEKIMLEPADQYTLQGDAFARAVLDDTEVPTPLEDAIGNMTVIDSIFESDEKECWVECRL
jgi:predicted dehydrogenase